MRPAKQVCAHHHQQLAVEITVGEEQNVVMHPVLDAKLEHVLLNFGMFEKPLEHRLAVAHLLRLQRSHCG